MQKTCKKCNETKNLNEFYPNKRMSDGHLNMCNVCSRKATTEYRLRNIEHYRSYDRLRAKNAVRIEQNCSQTKRRRSEVKGYMKAHNATARAIKKGSLVRMPCQMCGSIDHIHAHHDDYEMPLEVMWLCPEHHKSRHSFLDYLANMAV